MMLAVLKGRTACLLSCAALFLVGCSVNPATGKRELSLVSEAQEIAMGREADPAIVAQFGLYEDEELQAYVSELGLELAGRSERPNLPWTFRVLDDPLVNAFALPGGFIYITRGILAHLGSEAELVGVLGHEIGHVTARHGASQMSKQMLAQVGLGVGMIAAPRYAQTIGQLGGAGVGLLFLKYGRDDERQADSLGLRYSQQLDYDPTALMEVFEQLGRVSAAAGAERLPGWASTHPAPENRIALIDRQIRESGATGERIEARGYLSRLDGLIYGDNPRHGFFQDDVFYHPDMAFRFDVPSGWRTQNTRQAVAAVNSEQDAVLQLTLAQQESLDEALSSLRSQSSIDLIGRVRRANRGGVRSATQDFEVVSQEGVVTVLGRVSFVEYQDQLFQFIGYSSAERYESLPRPLRDSLGSFRSLRDRQKLEVQPLRLRLVEKDGAGALAADTGIGESVSVEELERINGLEPGESVSGGRLLKSVVGQRLN